MRPRTAHSSSSSRSATASNGRPFSAMTASRAATVSNRSQSSRSISIIGSTAHGAVVLPSQIRIQSRPLTAGLASSTKDTSNRKELNERLVHDASYYETLIKTRIRELKKEIEKVQNETFHTKKVLANHNELKHVHEQTQREIKDMENRMSDFNKALEMVRDGVDIEEMERAFFQIQERNELRANELDKLFLVNRRKQDELEEHKRKAELYEESMLETIENADENERLEFEELKKKLQDLRNEESEIQKQIESINLNISESRIQLQNRRDRENSIQYEEEKRAIMDLEEKLAAIEEDLRVVHMSDSDIHAYYIDKVKQEKKRATILCDELKDMEVTKVNLSEVLDAKKDELSKLSKKLEYCHQDALHDIFFEVQRARKSATEFEELIQKINDDIHKKRTKVSQLEHELNIPSDDEAPSKARLVKLKEDSDFHGKELTHSKFTLDKLLEEKDRRSKELGELNGLETKIETEEKQIIDSITEMEEELKIFQDHEKMQNEANDHIMSLKTLRERYETQIYILNPKVNALARKLEEKMNLLNKSQTFHTLKRLEDKIGRQSEMASELKEQILMKKAEVQYCDIKQNCLSLARDINSSMIGRL